MKKSILRKIIIQLREDYTNRPDVIMFFWSLLSCSVACFSIICPFIFYHYNIISSLWFFVLELVVAPYMLCLTFMQLSRIQDVLMDIRWRNEMEYTRQLAEFYSRSQVNEKPDINYDGNVVFISFPERRM